MSLHTGVLASMQYNDAVVVGTWLLGEFTDACDVGWGVEVLSFLGKVSLGSCHLPWPLLQMLAWCLPLHLLHFNVERHSHLMWFFLKYTCPSQNLLSFWSIGQCPACTWSMWLVTVWTLRGPWPTGKKWAGCKRMPRSLPGSPTGIPKGSFSSIYFPFSNMHYCIKSPFVLSYMVTDNEPKLFRQLIHKNWWQYTAISVFWDSQCIQATNLGFNSII